VNGNKRIANGVIEVYPLYGMWQHVYRFAR
jgi:hypothetical protein